MKQRVLALLCSLCLLLTLLPTVALGEEVTAAPASVSVIIDGKAVAFEAYSVDDNNYFKLRDLARALNGSKKQFNVQYNAEADLVEIITGTAYVPVDDTLSTPDVLTDDVPVLGLPTDDTLPVPDVITDEVLSDGGDRTEKQAILGNSIFSLTKEGYNITMEAYFIDGNNFIKLRDLMQWLDVNVGYDSANATIALSTTTAYSNPKLSGNPLLEASGIDGRIREHYGNSPGSLNSNPLTLYHKGNYYDVSNAHTIRNIIGEGTAMKDFDMNRNYRYYNLQAYGDKLIFEAQLTSSLDQHSTFVSNLDGSGIKKVISEGLYEGHNNMVYKGKLYSSTVSRNSKSYGIVSRNLDGSGKQSLVSGKLVHKGGGENGVTNMFAIDNDRIYFLQPTRAEVSYGPFQIMSIHLDGSELTPAGTLAEEYASLITVYNRVLYYTGKNGLCRSNPDGSNVICILPKSAVNLGINSFVTVYGDKILYSASDGSLGIVNIDGTSRGMMPNSPRSKDVRVSSVTPLSAQYTAATISLPEGHRYPLDTTRVLLKNDGNQAGCVEFYGSTAIAAWTDITQAFEDTEQQKTPVPTKLNNTVYYITSFEAPELGLSVSGADDANGTPITLYAADNKDHYQFKLNHVGNNKYTIMAVHSNKYLTSPKEVGKGLTQMPASARSDQIFTITPMNDGSYRIQDSSGFYWSISDRKFQNDTPIVLSPNVRDGSQTFLFQEA